MALAVRHARALARSAGLGQLRAMLIAAPWWVAVPPRRLKDFNTDQPHLEQSIALTFDDGPDAEVTPQLLDLLSAHSARATFFMCGLAAKRHPTLVRDVVDAGHTIGGHSWDHRLIRRLPEPEWRRQIDDTHALLEDLSGSPVRWFRPPWGHVDRYTRETLRRRGIATVRWSAAGRDWSLREPELIAESALNDLGPGGIVLLHDTIANYDSAGNPVPPVNGNQEPTLRATKILLDTVRERGLPLMALDELPAPSLPPVGRPRLPQPRRRDSMSP